MAPWEGQTVRRIVFEGDAADRLNYLQSRLPQAVGAPLDGEKVAASLRAVFGTGLLDTAEVLVRAEDGGVALIFRGEPRMFIGTVTVTGAKGATVNTQLERGSRLTAGGRFTPARLTRAIELMRQVLSENGYREPTITYTLSQRRVEQLTDVAFQVVSGPRARLGTVEVTGDSGMTLEQFQHEAHLRAGAVVDQETVNRALAGVLKFYRKEKRLEAEIKLESQNYANRKMNFRFTANRGPVVKVVAEGASLNAERLKRLVPGFEEGSVDDDMLNEGNRRIRDYFQSIGYFNVKVDHVMSSPHPEAVLIAYDVQLGRRGRVESVSVAGNHYFDSETLKEMLNVHPASLVERHGAYSQALVSADVNALTAVYQNNGF